VEIQASWLTVDFSGVDMGVCVGPEALNKMPGFGYQRVSSLRRITPYKFIQI
jgi:hypothetical protein